MPAVRWRRTVRLPHRQEKEPLSFPRADFGDAAEIILHLLRNEQGEEVEVSEGLEAFLDAVNIYDLESRTDDRTDFSVAFWSADVRSRASPSVVSQPHESFAGRRAHGQSEAGAERRWKFAVPTVNQG